MAHGQAGAEICSDGSPSLTCNHEAPIVTHALRAEGFDASEDGTGRGVPLWPIAFNSKDHGADASAGVPTTLRASGHDGSYANAGSPPAICFPERLSATQHASAQGFSPSLGATNPTAVAFALRGRDEGAQGEMHDDGGTVGALRAADGGSSRDYLATQYQVRRLTERECERLQGFPDDWTLIPWRGKPAEKCPGGPRYKALGNSMAVNVMRRIGRWIEFVEQILQDVRRGQ